MPLQHSEDTSKYGASCPRIRCPSLTGHPAYLSKENKREHVGCMSLSTHTLALVFFPYVVPVFRLKDEDVKSFKTT